jgi:hypothetical protein
MNPIVFHCIPQKGIAFEEGPFGNIETHWRRFSVKARLLERMWRGVEVSQTVRAIIENSPDADLKVCEGVVFEPKAKAVLRLSMGERRGSLLMDRGLR